MNAPEKNVEEIRKERLDPAFEEIKKHLISLEHKDPEIFPEEDAVKITFKAKEGEACFYTWWINEDGKGQVKFYRPPQDEITDTSRYDMSKMTPQMILDHFKGTFKLLI